MHTSTKRYLLCAYSECLHYLFEVVINMVTMGLDYTAPAITAAGVLDGTSKRPLEANGHETNGHKRHVTNHVNGHSNGHASGTYKVYLFDIEGTTTPISFVKDELFPHAAKAVDSFLSDTWDSKETQEDVAALYNQYQHDLTDPAIPDVVRALRAPPAVAKASKADQISWLSEYVRLNIQLDRKIGALKQLQGHIWRRGYEAGTIKGALFPEIASVFSQIVHSGARVAIYSSGSREAQKLLFKYSSNGDLSKHISCYFDTAVGGKREAKSYQEILLSLGVDQPSDVLFLTDIFEEAQAATAAGIHVALSVRPGNGPLPTGHGMNELTSFSGIVA